MVWFSMWAVIIYDGMIFFFVLQVTVSDNGSPSALTSTTKVVVAVDDINDNAPVFDKKSYDFKIPESKHQELAIQQVRCLVLGCG